MEPKPGVPEFNKERFAKVQHYLDEGMQRARDHRKIWMFPFDLLVVLLEDPEVQGVLASAQIDEESLRTSIQTLESREPTSFDAVAFLTMVGALSRYDAENGWVSLTLNLQVRNAQVFADRENSFLVGPRHLLASLALDDMSTSHTAFVNLGLTPAQWHVLAGEPLIV